MAKLEKTITGNFNDILRRIENGIINGSVSASLEECSDFYIGETRCSVRVFERYSYMGGNRVSLNVIKFSDCYLEIMWLDVYRPHLKRFRHFYPKLYFLLCSTP